MVADEPVPPALRSELVALAARTLAGYDPAAVPPALRRVAGFAPAKRATAGAVPLWAALQDEPLRTRTARTWADEQPVLAAALEADTPSAPIVPSVPLAAGAWLLGRDWRPLLPPEGAPPGPHERATSARARDAAPSHAQAELARSCAEHEAALAEIATLRRQARRLRSDADRARAEGRRAADEARELVAQARAARDEAERVQAAAADDRRAADAERAAARAELRVARRLADARVRLLLDTIVDAASGLRSELALPPTTDLPADLVVPPQDVQAARVGSRGRLVDDPALLDELLRQPRAHLVVDGYNVTKSAYPELTLEQQRRLLVDGLAALASRSGTEVTCCFDGRPTPLAAGVLARGGVRVRFSVGEIADDLIRRIVQAEPVGRVLVVVTSDQEVVRDVEARGAYVVPSATLAARLQRP